MVETRIDKKLQSKILQHLAFHYPDTPRQYLPADLEYSLEKDAELLRANFYYLSEIGLVVFRDQKSTSWPDGYWRINELRATSTTVDMFMQDGGIDSVYAEILKLVSSSDEKPSIIRHALSLLKNISTEAKAQLITKLVSLSINETQGIAGQILLHLQQETT